jgi:hypothetical protein
VLLPFGCRTGQSYESIVPFSITKISQQTIPPHQNREFPLTSQTLKSLPDQLHPPSCSLTVIHHGAHVPTANRPSMPLVWAALYTPDNFSREPQRQCRPSILRLHKRRAPSQVLILGRHPRHCQRQPAMLVRVYKS